MNIKKTISIFAFILTCSTLLFSQEALKIEKEKFAHEIYNVPPHPKGVVAAILNAPDH